MKIPPVCLVREPAPVSAAARQPQQTRFDRIFGILSQHPTILNLRRIVEENPGHHSDVLTHTLKAAEAGRSFLNLEFIVNPTVRNRVSRYFEVVVDPDSEHRYTRAELVYAAIFLHDIGKAMIDPASGEPILQRKGGRTTCYRHDRVGAQPAAEIARAALNCSESETQYVETIVRKHMLGFDLVSQQEKSSTPLSVAERRSFLKMIGYDPALLLHFIADAAGCDADPTTLSAFYINLFDLLFTIEQVTGSTNDIGFADTIEKLEKKHSVIFVPGKDSGFIATKLYESVRATLVPKVAAGLISADQLDGIVAKKVRALLSKIEFRPGEQSAEAIEAHFDFNFGLTRNPVILQIATAAPRPEIEVCQKE